MVSKKYMIPQKRQTYLQSQITTSAVKTTPKAKLHKLYNQD
jgi:hypothetical protein